MTTEIVEIIKRLLPRAVAKKLPSKIKVVSISWRESRILNKCYRHKNKPSNVLSFPYDLDYGEILVCPSVIRREAKKQGNSYKYQMTWMIIHGMLHLAGIHHEGSKRAARVVAELERSIMNKMAGKKAQSTKSKAQIKPQSTGHKV